MDARSNRKLKLPVFLSRTRLGRSLFGQIVLTFCGYAALLILLLGVYSMYRSTCSMEQQVIRSHEEMLEQTSGTLNQVLDDLTLLLHSTMMDSDVIRLAISPNLRDFENIKAVTNALTNAAQASTLIDSVFLYSARSDLGLSSDYTESNYQDYSYEAVLARFQTRKNKMVPYEAHGTATYFYTENKDIYLIQGFSNIKYEKCSCYILFHLDTPTFFRLLNSMEDPALRFYYQSNLLNGPEDSPFYCEILEKIMESGQAEGSLIHTSPAEGGSWHVIYSFHLYTGWLCVYAAGPAVLFVSRFPALNFLMRGMLLAGILFGVVGIIISARRIARPMGNLLQTIHLPEDQDGEGRSEWEYIESAYAHLRSRTEELEHYLPMASESIEEQMFSEIFRGEDISPAHFDRRMRLVESRFSAAQQGTVFLGEFCPDSSLQDTLVRELAEFKLRHDIACCMKAVDLPFHLMAKDSKNIVCLVCAFENSETQYETVLESLRGICAEGGRILWGSGTPIPLPQLQTAFTQARNELDFQRYHGYVDVQENSKNAHIGEIRDIMAKVQAENISDLWEEFAGLLDQLDKVSEPRSLYQLLLELLNDRMTALHVDARTDISLQNIPDEILAGHVRRTCQTMLQQVDAHVRSRRQKYVVIAQEHIRTHFADPNLSLESAAESIGINATYLSRIFKPVSGENFNAALNRCRVDNACKLLSTTEMPAQEVGYLTGFCSVATFFRVFKKYTGMTPKQYRKSVQEEV